MEESVGLPVDIQDEPVARTLQERKNEIKNLNKSEGLGANVAATVFAGLGAAALGTYSASEGSFGIGALMGSTAVAITSLGAHDYRKMKRRGEAIDDLDGFLENSVRLGDQDVSELLEGSENVKLVTDYRLEETAPGNYSFSEFEENGEIALYERILNDNYNLEQWITYEDGGSYILDLEDMEGEFLARFEGVIEDDISQYLEDGTPVMEGDNYF